MPSIPFVEFESHPKRYGTKMNPVAMLFVNAVI
jgi:hypothetical protein